MVIFVHPFYIALIIGHECQCSRFSLFIANLTASASSFTCQLSVLGNVVVVEKKGEMVEHVENIEGESKGSGRGIEGKENNSLPRSKNQTVTPGKMDVQHETKRRQGRYKEKGKRVVYKRSEKTPLIELDTNLMEEISLGKRKCCARDEENNRRIMEGGLYILEGLEIGLRS
ncbi:hypothetical protein ACH5RR_036919 [Cinchona calisaya]|uniref:Uncharacterized protein n=1 Tax=Cinchona calisaya TaxID=153742 RepID=A0ABD2Y8F1_9GENT